MSGTYTKLNGRWRVQVQVDKQRRSKMFDNKALAKAWAAEQVAKGSGSQSLPWTLNELIEKYKADKICTDKKGAPKEIIRLNYYQREYPDLCATCLADITPQDIEDLINDRLDKVKPGSVNRDLNLLSFVLTQGRRWKMMSNKPFTDVKRPKSDPHRERRITQAETKLILAALDYSEEFPLIQQMQKSGLAFLLAIETAMRQSEITLTEWANVHLDDRYIFLPAKITKTGKPRNVPLSQEAVRLIRRLQECGEQSEFMLGVTAATVSTYVREAIKAAGIEGMTFHDTRHEATTRLAQKLQVLDLARVTGHRDIKQLMIYYNKDAKELAGLL